MEQRVCQTRQFRNLLASWICGRYEINHRQLAVGTTRLVLHIETTIHLTFGANAQRFIHGVQAATIWSEKEESRVSIILWTA